MKTTYLEKSPESDAVKGADCLSVKLRGRVNYVFE